MRLALVLLLFAVMWAAARPAVVDFSAEPTRGIHDDPESWADDQRLPEPFDPPRSRASHGIDPEPHRPDIERIEARLYRRAPADFGDAEAVAGEVLRLAHDLLGGSGMRGRRAGLELTSFANRVGARADSGYALPRLPQLRREWEQVRLRVFRPADWMRTASADLDRVQDPPPPAPDPRTAEALTHAAAALERLLARGQRDVERLGEPRYDPERPRSGGSSQIRAWYHWGELWRQELLDALAPVRALHPPPHPARQPLQAAALRALEQAAEMLRRVPDGAGMWATPFRPAWESRFRAARASLSEARTQLAAMLPAS